MDVPVAAEQIKSASCARSRLRAKSAALRWRRFRPLREGGLKDFEPIDQWWAVFAPAATPPVIVSKLEVVFNRVVGSDDTKTFLANGGAEPFPGNAAHLKELLASDIKRWRVACGNGRD